MKQYIVDRHTDPSNPSLISVPSEKIPVYDTKDDAEDDLANLTVGQIVATKDTGDELAIPVDSVQSGNLHAVTSNAVFNAIKEEVLWENPNPTSSFSPTTLTSQTLGKDLSKYYAIYIYAKNVSVGGNYSVSKVYKDLPITMTVSATSMMARNVTFTDNGIAFESGYITANYGGNASADNNAIVPIKIWGVKGV